MKKFLILMLMVLMLVPVLASCGNQKKDWEYIKDKGEIVVGITIYDPMNYYDDNNNLIGLDTEFTEAVCAELGVKAKFQVIDWKMKESELKSRKIDCIWNGLTVDDERRENMAFSNYYMENRQVAVIRKADAEKYSTLESLKDSRTVAENSSAGEKAIKADANLSQSNFTAGAKQTNALLEIKSGTADIAVVDVTTAESALKEGSPYTDLMILDFVTLDSEYYAVGLRLEDTEFLAKLNAAMKAVSDRGDLNRIAEKYGQADRIIKQ
mgnify:CR=1 FL=1